MLLPSINWLGDCARPIVIPFASTVFITFDISLAFKLFEVIIIFCGFFLLNCNLSIILSKSLTLPNTETPLIKSSLVLL